MSEKSHPGTIDYYTAPDEELVAEDIFQKVYESFTVRAKEKKVDNPATDFVKTRFDAATRRIAPLEHQPMRPADFATTYYEDAARQAHEVYGERQVAIGVRLERVKRVITDFTDRAIQMVKEGGNSERDRLTAKLFFSRIDELKHGFSLGYNDLLTKDDEANPGREAQNEYAHAIHNAFAEKQDTQEQENGAFLHVNAHRPSSGETERFYISPKLNGEPEKVVKVWTDTLASMGLEDELYYKVARGLNRRYDMLIAYATPETADKMEAAIHEFSEQCPEDLLSDTTLPSGVEIAKGVARAPEPRQLNTLFYYRGKELISYNELVCALSELALRRASYDYTKQGVSPQDVTPKELSEAAKPYFVQFVTLSGLDPVTMKAMA